MDFFKSEFGTIKVWEAILLFAAVVVVSVWIFSAVSTKMEQRKSAKSKTPTPSTTNGLTAPNLGSPTAPTNAPAAAVAV